MPKSLTTAFKKIFFAFLILPLFLLAPLSTQAEELPSSAVRDFYFNQDSYRQAVEETAQGKVNFEGWGFKGEANIVAGTSCLIHGRCLSDSGQASAGSFNIVSNLTASLFSSPVDTSQYLAYQKSKINLAKPAYASVGTAGLTPIIALWEISRNIAYLFFIIIFIVAGFMIMFRSKLNPQTTINLQLALPKIIISLLLVTFSFAIMALIIDLSEALVYIIANLYSGFSEDPSNVSTWISQLTGQAEIPGVGLQNIFSLMSSLGRESRTALGPTIANLISEVGGAIWKFLEALGASGSLAELIIAIAVLGALFKTFFALLTAYVSIIISAIFSPLAFLMAGFPGGQSAPFGLVKSVLANALVFPATLGFLLIGAITSSTGATEWGLEAGIVDFSGGNAWVPFGLSGLQGAAGIGTLIQNLIALGVLLAVPNIPRIVKEALQVKEGAALAAAGEGFRGALANVPLVGGLIR